MPGPTIDVPHLMGWMTKTQNSLREIGRRLRAADLEAEAYPLGEAIKEIEEAKTRLYTGKAGGRPM